MILWRELGMSLKSFLPDTSMIFGMRFKGSDTGVLYRFFQQNINKHVCLLCIVYKSGLSLVLSGLYSLCLNGFLYFDQRGNFSTLVNFIVSRATDALLSALWRSCWLEIIFLSTEFSRVRLLLH